MERLEHYTKSDAKAVLTKHQRKATPHRVDVLLYMMNNRRAFTFKMLVEIFEVTIDRTTVYRTLIAFVKEEIIGKALNEKGYTCFFFKGHLVNTSNAHLYLECESCDQIFGLPEYPGHYLRALKLFQATPLVTLLKGHCNRADCTDKSMSTN